MTVYATMPKNANRKRTGFPPDPVWVIWHGPNARVSMPFVDGDEMPEHAWHQVLESTFLGYRADRVGDTLHITGRPVGFEGGLA